MSAALFANLASTLQNGCVYLFETTHASQSVSLSTLHASDSTNNRPILDEYRNGIVMDYIETPITVYNTQQNRTYRETSVALFPGDSALIMCAVMVSGLFFSIAFIRIVNPANQLHQPSGLARTCSNYQC